jgi:hypothetical protein
MFRGGPVSSYGTGIAAPLVPGYKGGGQIGGGTIHGIPYLDGRYGFKIPRYDTSAGPEITLGGEITEEIKQKPWLSESLSIPTVNEDAENVATKIYDVEPEGEEEVVNTTDKYITKIIGRDKTPKLVKNPDYEPPTKTITGTRRNQKFTRQVPLSEEEIKTQKILEDSDFHPGQISFKPDAPLEDPPPPPEEKPELTAKEMVAENKELFRDLLGYKKARGQDISEMLLGFAGAEGDDTMSKFKSFFRDEAKRPGKAQKIDETAAALAINDYIAGKRSKEQLLRDKSKIDYTQDVKLDALVIDKDDSLSTVATKLTAVDKDINSMKGLREVISAKDEIDGRLVYPTSLKLKDILKGNSKKILKNLKEGYNIIDNEGVKWIVKYDGSGSIDGVSKPVTITQFWNQTS